MGSIESTTCVVRRLNNSTVLFKIGSDSELQLSNGAQLNFCGPIKLFGADEGAVETLKATGAIYSNGMLILSDDNCVPFNRLYTDQQVQVMYPPGI